MKLLVQALFLAPFLVIVVVLAIVDRACRGHRSQRVAPPGGWLVVIGDGMLFGVLVAAVVSLTVILFSDGLSVPARALPLVAWLPLVGGYVGAAVGFHLAGNDPGPAEGHADEK